MVGVCPSPSLACSACLVKVPSLSGPLPPPGTTGRAELRETATECKQPAGWAKEEMIKINGSFSSYKGSFST